MSFANASHIWKNGQIIPWNEATIHISVHGLHYGTGVFEGIRCYKTVDGPAIFRLTDHMKRFLASAKIHFLNVPYTVEELDRACVETVRANGLESGYIRPISFFGSGSLSLFPGACPVETAVLAWSWGVYLGEDSLKNGIRATISSWAKFDTNALPTEAKACGQYLNSVLATHEARARGFEEALLLNSRGDFAEGAGENLFIVKNGTLYTNGLAGDAILQGITRDTVLTLAREREIPVVIRSLSRTDLFTADEAFITGTAAEVVPLREVDGRAIGSDTARPVTRTIQDAFRAVVEGRDPHHRDWLTYVPEATDAARA